MRRRSACGRVRALVARAIAAHSSALKRSSHQRGTSRGVRPRLGGSPGRGRRSRGCDERGCAARDTRGSGRTQAGRDRSPADGCGSATAAVGASVRTGVELGSNGGPTHRLDAGLDASLDCEMSEYSADRGRTWPPPRGDESDGNRDLDSCPAPATPSASSMWPTWIHRRSSLSSPLRRPPPRSHRRCERAAGGASDLGASCSFEPDLSLLPRGGCGIISSHLCPPPFGGGRPPHFVTSSLGAPISVSHRSRSTALWRSASRSAAACSASCTRRSASYSRAAAIEPAGLAAVFSRSSSQRGSLARRHRALLARRVRS